MPQALNLLKCVAKAAGNAFGGGFVGDVVFELVPELAAEAWKWWHADRDAEGRRLDLIAVAQASPVEVREQAKQLVLEFAGDRPEVEQKRLEVYLSLVPGQVRQSLRRPSDPGGTTVPAEVRFDQADDLIPLLPPRLPRFQPGDHPLPGVDWQLEELLGVGGFGEVWKARNPMLASAPPVALKFCLDAAAARYLRNEAAVLDRVMRQGRHSGIVPLQHTYLSAETPCLEYEFVAGGDLGSLIREWHRRTPRPSAVDITRVLHQLAAIVGFAHTQTPPIVHRDLKPANILLQPMQNAECRTPQQMQNAECRMQNENPVGAALGSGAGRPSGGATDAASHSAFCILHSDFCLKVADFGIGGVASRHAIGEQTRGGTRGQFLVSALRGACTPLYAGPQQMRGALPDPRDDVYALGVIWYQMLTGDLTAGRPGGTRWQRRLADLGLDAPLVELMGECFEDNLDDRLSDAATLAARLAALLPASKDEPRLAPAAMVERPVSPGPDRARPEPPAPAYRPVSAAVAAREDAERRKRADLAEQLRTLDRAVAADPDDAAALARRAELHRQLGNHDQAIRDATEAIRLQPGHAAPYATRGCAHRMKGQLDLALGDCTEALRLDPKRVLAYFNRGEVYRLRRELDRALADFGRAVELDPNYAWAYASRAAARQQKGDHAGALADLDHTLRLEPSYAWAYAVRGETYRLLGKLDQAIADCTDALRLQPDSFMAFATRGAAFRQKGDFATALADLGQALRLRPDYQWARDQQDLARRSQR